MSAMVSRSALEEKQQRREHWALVKAQLVEVWSMKFRGQQVIQESEESTRAILELCASYTDVSFQHVVPSAGILREIWLTNRQPFLERLGPYLTDLGIVRENLIASIVSAHEAGRARLGRPALNDFEKAQIVGRLRNGYTLQALKNNLAQVITAQSLLGRSKAEVQSYVDAARAADEPLPKRIPDEYTPSVLKRKLYQWPKSRTDWFINEYGKAAVDARLNGTDGFVAPTVQR